MAAVVLEPEHAVVAVAEPAVVAVVVVELAVVPAVAAVVGGSDFVVVAAAVVGEAVGDVVASVAETYWRFKALWKLNDIIMEKLRVRIMQVTITIIKYYITLELQLNDVFFTI